jgi:hypothetical protein
MTNQYKYISKPYTFEELVNGNPIFKVYCNFFNDLYEWEQEQNFIEHSSLIDTDHLTKIFNEFLNFVSLLIYDKLNYHDNLKKLLLKSEELENLNYLMMIIPHILDNNYLLSDSTIAQNANKIIFKNTNSNSKVDVNDSFSKVVKKFHENLEDAITKENIHDLIYFFDLSQIKIINDLSSALLAKGKRKGNPLEFISTKSESIKLLDTSLQVLLFEQIMKIENWDQVSSTKKGQLLSLLISKNDSNIKKVYLELEKNSTQNTKKILEDREKAFEIIKEILG